MIRQCPMEQSLHECQDIVAIGSRNTRKRLLHEFAYMPYPDIGNRSGRAPRPVRINLPFVNLVVLSGAGALRIICQDGLQKICNGAAGCGFVNPVARAQIIPSIAACGLKIRAFEFVPRGAACYKFALK